jgi:hypothetical protein
MNGRGRYRNGRGQNHNGRGLEKYGHPCGSRRRWYINFVQDMNLQEVYIIEYLNRTRKIFVVLNGSIKIYLLNFILKLYNTF